MMSVRRFLFAASQWASDGPIDLKFCLNVVEGEVGYINEKRQFIEISLQTKWHVDLCEVARFFLL